MRTRVLLVRCTNLAKSGAGSLPDARIWSDLARDPGQMHEFGQIWRAILTRCTNLARSGAQSWPDARIWPDLAAEQQPQNIMKSAFQPKGPPLGRNPEIDQIREFGKICCQIWPDLARNPGQMHEFGQIWRAILARCTNLARS